MSLKGMADESIFAVRNTTEFVMMIKILIVLAIIVLAYFVLEIAVAMVYVVLELLSELAEVLPDCADGARRKCRIWKWRLQIARIKRQAGRNAKKVRKG